MKVLVSILFKLPVLDDVFHMCVWAVSIIVCSCVEGFVFRIADIFAVGSHFRLHIGARVLKQKHSPFALQENNWKKPNHSQKYVTERKQKWKFKFHSAGYEKLFVGMNVSTSALSTIAEDRQLLRKFFLNLQLSLHVCHHPKSTISLFIDKHKLQFFINHNFYFIN